MSGTRILKDVEALRALADRLSKCKVVTALDCGDEREAWTLAHALSDLEESFRKVLDEYLPRLARADLGETEVHDLLLEIGEELRHVLYHIKDPKFFRYLLDQHEQDEAG